MNEEEIRADERIKIRNLKLSDAEDIYRNINDKEVARWTLNIPYPYPKDGAVKFIRRTHSKMRKKESYSFGIILKEANKMIGIASFTHVNWKHKNAEIGYWIGKKYWGNGFATEAVRLMLRFGFETLKLHRIYENIYDKNTGSRKVVEKCGFRQEGVLRQARYNEGKWHDEIRYGVLVGDHKP